MIDMAQAFDNAKNDDFFYLAPEALDTENFKVGLDFFMTRDGKGARFMVFHKGEATSPAGIEQTRNALTAAEESIKQTALSNAKLDIAGAAPTHRDVEDFSHNDLILMMLATFALVFVIVLVLTRALVGSIIVLVIVVLSFAGALGLAALIWETFLGIQLHWLNVPIAFIVLVGVGCDYNLLLLSRYREEIDAGVATGMIRAIAGSFERGSDGGPGPCRHDAGASFQRCEKHRPSRVDYRHRADFRHVHHAAVPGDADRAVAWPVVLVAAENSQSPKTRYSYGGRCTSALATPAVIKAENLSMQQGTINATRMAAPLRVAGNGLVDLSIRLILYSCDPLGNRLHERDSYHNRARLWANRPRQRPSAATASANLTIGASR